MGVAWELYESKVRVLGFFYQKNHIFTIARKMKITKWCSKILKLLPVGLLDVPNNATKFGGCAMHGLRDMNFLVRGPDGASAILAMEAGGIWDLQQVITLKPGHMLT